MKWKPGTVQNLHQTVTWGHRHGNGKWEQMHRHGYITGGGGGQYIHKNILNTSSLAWEQNKIKTQKE